MAGELTMTPVGGALADNTGNALVSSREAAEVQAAIVAAQMCPRDIDRVLADIERMCRLPALAESAGYAYPRGNEVVSGASIKLVEAIGQTWGNLQATWRIIETRPATKDNPRKRDEVAVYVIEAIAWDVQTNYRHALRFEVPHWRDTKGGGYALKSERDAYELAANMASRRLRSCLERVIPRWVVDHAKALCDQTVIDAANADLANSLRKLEKAFIPLGVERSDLVAFLGRNGWDAVTAEDVATLRGVFNSIRKGQPAGDFFPRLDSEPVATTNEDAERTFTLGDADDAGGPAQ